MQTNRINSEEMFMLRRKLIKWLEGLVRVNSEPDYNNKTPRKALDKFILTIDFMIYEVFRFIKFNHFESPEVMEIAERLNWLFKELVNELVNSTKSIKVCICTKYSAFYIIIYINIIMSEFKFKKKKNHFFYRC